MAEEQPHVEPTQDEDQSTPGGAPSGDAGHPATTSGDDLAVDRDGGADQSSDLLDQLSGSEEEASLIQAVAGAADAGGSDGATGGDFDQASIDELLKQGSFEDPSSLDGGDAVADTVPLDLQNFTQVIQDAQVSSIDLLRDVELNVKIELGRSRMLVEDILKLSEGAVVELDKLAGDPVDVFVNDRLVARGEVLVLNDNFCVRINEIVAGVKEEGL